MLKAGIILASLMRTIPLPTTEDMATLRYGNVVCGFTLTIGQEEDLIQAYGRQQMTTTYFKKRQKMVAAMFEADPKGSCEYALQVYQKFFTITH